MGCERFDVGIWRDAPEMILREGQGATEIERAIKWLRYENANGAHIYVRPVLDRAGVQYRGRRFIFQALSAS